MSTPHNKYSLTSTTDLGIASRHAVPKIEIQNSEFKNLFPTNINVKLNLPIVKTTDQFILGINLDGFIPQFNIAEDYPDSAAIPAKRNVYNNLFPVQFIKDYYHPSNPAGQITQSFNSLAIQSMYQSYRFVDGAVNVVARISANTSMTGNLITGRLRTGVRRYYASNEINRGLDISNFLGNVSDIAHESFSLIDLSLNRTFATTCDRLTTTPATDIAMKIDQIAKITTFPDRDIIQQQFTEDWLLFGIVADIPASQSNVMYITFYLDYSNVTFEAPMLYTPSMPEPDAPVVSRVLDITASFYNRSAAERLPYVYVPI
jgi:hypothetical protein